MTLYYSGGNKNYLRAVKFMNFSKLHIMITEQKSTPRGKRDLHYISSPSHK